MHTERTFSLNKIEFNRHHQLMSQPQQHEYFPSIGNVADKTDADVLDNDNLDAADKGERPIEEVSSLCMACGEQVTFSCHDHYPRKPCIKLVHRVLRGFS